MPHIAKRWVHDIRRLLQHILSRYTQKQKWSTKKRVIFLKSRWFRRKNGMKREEEKTNTLRLQKGGSLIAIPSGAQVTPV